jgi:folylpolyglutamate synthase/dihydropteroate synthase
MATLRAISEPNHNIIIFGCMERKDLGAFPEKAVKNSRKVLLAPLRSSGAAGRDDLAARFGLTGEGEAVAEADVVLCQDMEEALRLAIDSLKREDTLIVLGSHHAVEEAVLCM